VLASCADELSITDILLILILFTAYFLFVCLHFPQILPADAAPLSSPEPIQLEPQIGERLSQRVRGVCHDWAAYARSTVAVQDPACLMTFRASPLWE
jgi:hypothetical protein